MDKIIVGIYRLQIIDNTIVLKHIIFDVKYIERNSTAIKFYNQGVGFIRLIEAIFVEKAKCIYIAFIKINI